MMDLIARLEAAETGSAELDYLIDEALSEWRNIGGGFAVHKVTGERRRNSFDCSAPVTTSLDAALALAERVLSHTTFRIDFDERPRVWAFDKEDCFGRRSAIGSRVRDWEAYADAPTSALALCIAILKAKLAEEPTKG